ncbi:YceI family protein [Alteromonas sp. CYL-A6]|uniref:YceI family protein n=1 Tax=Alteromonas nitratireducens TaxID=3390813 RepID=UPI0034C4997A
MKLISKSLLTTAVLSLGATFPAAADWMLNDDASALHFMTTKNAQVSEVHQFHSLSGSVTDDGALTVSVDLASVDTAIDIRNTRMKEMLFQVADFPHATFTASLPESMTALESGDTETGTVDGTLTLHGEAVPVSFQVRASKLNDTTMVVSTVAPTLIKAKSFGLSDGVMALQNIAGLNSITTTVPLTFSVVFSK